MLNNTTNLKFEFPKGVQSSQEKRYVILEVVDFSSSMQQKVEDIVQSVMGRITEVTEQIGLTESDQDLQDSDEPMKTYESDQFGYYYYDPQAVKPDGPEQEYARNEHLKQFQSGNYDSNNPFIPENSQKLQANDPYRGTFDMDFLQSIRTLITEDQAVQLNNAQQNEGRTDNTQNTLDQGSSDVVTPENEDRNPSRDVRTSYNNTRSTQKHEGRTIFAIALPYPSTFTEETTQNWSSSKGILGSALGKFEEMSVPLVGMNVSKFLGQTANVQGTRKPLINPGYFQDYEGPEPRTFTMEWQLIPNSAEEANEIQLIVYNLKKFTSPDSRVQNSLLLQPFMINITMMSQTINQVQGMDLLVCKNISVDWGSKSQLRPDGSPKQITLSMQFAERRALSFNDY